MTLTGGAEREAPASETGVGDGGVTMPVARKFDVG
jgi:hypothetical protein